MRTTKIIISIAVALTAITIVSLAGEMGGTGVWIVDRTNDNDPLTTLMVFPNSPGERAGIKPGWFLISVNGTNVVHTSATNAVNMIRGPVGTFVTLGLADPKRSKTNDFTVKRGRIVIQNNSVQKIIDP
jgi:carboxyl-terminal processing protease